MDLRARLSRLLGPGFPGAAFAEIARKSVSDCHGWVLEDLLFTSATGEAIPAFLLRPPDRAAPVPAVVYCHAHGNRYQMGRDELLAGRPALQGAYAADLVAAGIAALCIEMPCFGARVAPDESTCAKAALWRGETLFGQMLAEQRAGVDFLAGHPSVRADRIGAVGFSMGSTLAFWLAALDPRIRATCASGSLADLATLVDQGAHDGHGIYMMVPGLLPVARSGQIAGLAAPRALQVAVGLRDAATPEAAVDVARADLEAAYSDGGRLDFVVEAEAGHEETPSMRAAVLRFLSEELAPAR